MKNRILSSLIAVLIGTFNSLGAVDMDVNSITVLGTDNTSAVVTAVDSGLRVNGTTISGGAGLADSDAIIFVQEGDNVVTKYAEACALTPNSTALSSANRAALVIMPGTYALSGTLTIAANFVDIVGLGSASQKPAVLFTGNSISCPATYLDVRVMGISVGAQAWAYEGVSDASTDKRVFTNSTGGSYSFGYANPGTVYASSTFTGCVVGDRSFANSASTGDAYANGTFTDCYAGTYTYGAGAATGYASGKFTNCRGGVRTFGFGYAAEGVASGTFTTCTATGLAFGAAYNPATQNGTASGGFTNCIVGDHSLGYGASGTTASGTFTNTTAGSGCFGSFAPGTITGRIINSQLSPGSGNYITPTGTGYIRNSLTGDGVIINSGSDSGGLPAGLTFSSSGGLTNSSSAGYSFSNSATLNSTGSGSGAQATLTSAGSTFNLLQTDTNGNLSGVYLVSPFGTTTVMSSSTLPTGTIGYTTDANKLVFGNGTSSPTLKAFGVGDSSSVIFAQAGDNILTKYTAACALTPNGSAKSATNRATLVIMPGTYALSGILTIAANYVDIIGIGSTEKKPSVLFTGYSISCPVTYLDVRVTGISVGTQAFAVVGTATTASDLRVFTNCVGGDNSFGYSAAAENVYASSTFVGCVGGINSFGSWQAATGVFSGVASGTFLRCDALAGSFGCGSLANPSSTSIASGTFTDCLVSGTGFLAFGGSATGTCTVSGTFTNCSAPTLTAGAFGGSTTGTVSGTFINCVADSEYGFRAATMTGKMIGCRSTSTTAFQTPSGGGYQRFCLLSNGTVVSAP